MQEYLTAAGQILGAGALLLVLTNGITYDVAARFFYDNPLSPDNARNIVKAFGHEPFYKRVFMQPGLSLAARKYR